MGVRRIACLLLILIVLSLLGCASTKKAFEEASNEGTIEAYEKFISEHPNDPLTVEARERVSAKKLQLQVVDFRSHGPGERFVLPFDIGDGFQTKVTFENAGMRGGDFQWGRGGTGRMVAGDGSLFTFIGANQFPDSEGPYQMGSMKAYLPGALVGTEVVASESSPLVFILVRPHGLVHISGKGTIRLRDGQTFSLPR